MIDLRAPKAVDVTIDLAGGGWVLWVNVDGVCVLRIYDLPDDTRMEDRRIGIDYSDNGG